MSPALWLLAPVSRSVYRRVGRVAGRAGRYYARFTAYCRGCGASSDTFLLCLDGKEVLKEPLRDEEQTEVVLLCDLGHSDLISLNNDARNTSFSIMDNTWL